MDYWSLRSRRLAAELELLGKLKRTKYKNKENENRYIVMLNDANKHFIFWTK
jgi:hypothetical protein